MNKRLLLLSVLAAAVSFSSCKKSLTGEDGLEPEIENAAPEGFAYSTSKPVDLSIRLLTRDDKPISGVMVSVFKAGNTTPGAEITRGISDKDGYIKTTVSIPSSIQNLVIDPAFVGLVRNAEFAISGGSLSATIGGASGISSNYVPSTTAYNDLAASYNLQKISSLRPGDLSIGSSTTGTVYQYSSANYDANGRPNAVLAPAPGISIATLIQQINASLPERKNGIDLHPEYTASQAPTNLKVTTLSDVWISFVHEGATNKNTLGYYAYPTGHPPITAAQIDTVHVILPNASLAGSSGSLISGDRVKIGRFPAGTTIGFVLIQNGYNSDKSIAVGNQKFYTDEQYNTYTTSPVLKRHNVLLQSTSTTNKIFLVGFEDIKRNLPACDNDFNDLVFFAQAQTVSSIDPTNIPYLEENVVDTDGDGVPDVIDEYPTDGDRVYNKYFPSKSIWGTFAFEDNWPLEGDYDLNDLVLSYRYTFVMNKENKIMDIVSELKPLAAGAIYQHGFGIQIPVATNLVKKVTGYNLTSNYINLTATGIESGQANAVIIPFDQQKSLFRSDAAFINTRTEGGYRDADTVKVKLTFNSAYSDALSANAPFNPFLISKGVRGTEIHLVNGKPTQLANNALFGTGKDKSVPASNKFYVGEFNRPFAMNFLEGFSYPLEKADIKTAYPHFSQWALSGGGQYKDWYSNTASGFRNNQMIYVR